MFLNSDIPSNYNKLAEIGDNYIILVRESILESGTTYDAYLQYLNGSTQFLHLTNYRIKEGDNYEYTVNYINNGYYNYIDSVSSSFSYHTIDISDQVNNDIQERFDYPSIFVCQFLCVIVVVWLINQLSKLVIKGGVFSA